MHTAEKGRADAVGQIRNLDVGADELGEVIQGRVLEVARRRGGRDVPEELLEARRAAMRQANYEFVVPD